MPPYSLYRIIPFATFMAFIGCEELLRFLGKKGVLALSDSLFLYIYPFRALTVGLLLVLFWRRYREIRYRDLLNYRNTLLSIGVGVFVFILWINVPWTLRMAGTPAGYDPTAVSENFTHYLLIVIRLLGAAIVVPIMEELFWRSFLLRYAIHSDISQVSIGAFTWPSLLTGSLLFGLEHHQFYAGVAAGVAYSLLLYRTRSLVQCILCHGVTNALLGGFVLLSGRWNFW